jgi:hypothetical protein
MILLFLIIFSSTGFAQDEKAYAYEKNIGKALGKVYGQKDAIKNEGFHWEKAFYLEEKNFEKTYDFNKEIQQEKFKEGFKEGYINGYKNFHIRNSLAFKMDTIGENHGKILGDLMGKIYGKKDFIEGKSNDWSRNNLSSIAIENKYQLDLDTQEYAQNFITGYKSSYKTSYINAFRMLNIAFKKDTLEKGNLHGMELGKNNGEILGKIDYEENKINDWKTALPSDEEILTKFHLLKENIHYRLAFLVSYKEGFQKSYTSTFQKENMNRAKENTDYKKISIKGGKITSADENVNLLIEEGTIYQPAFFNISKKYFPLPMKKYEPLSHIYEVHVKNYAENVNLRKPILLSFQYYGSETGGIYQYINHEWVYLYSTIEKDRIFTEIPISIYRGGTYVVCIDENYEELMDIYGHWAEKEIYSFLRRDYIKGYPDKTFKPDQSIMMNEFFALLNKVSKNNPLIAQCMNDYKDHRDDLISYEEVEEVIQKSTNAKNFNWDTIAEKMIYEKFTRSKSYHGKDQMITRAETLYMLYILEQEKKL